MTSTAPSLALNPAVCHRALDARDARFDGLFFVGITTTMIYCRPVCPARISYRDRRRFFDSAAAAEEAGFRPCLRCRPELAPGRALVDAVPRLARAAESRIAGGALNGRGVDHLARELGVGERQLRRAMERELGVSPVELAQTHRLLLAKRLLADTSLSVTRIAFASGFQSLRRFNSVFRERYRLSPSALRRTPALSDAGRDAGAGRGSPAAPAEALVRLTLAYRAPLAWHVLTALLQRDAMPGVEVVQGRCYGRTVRLNGASGVVFAEDAVAPPRDPQHAMRTHLQVDVSPALLPVLMPLLARLRHLFDLDAEPTVIDACLERSGLGPLVRRRPGLRIPGAVEGFEVALRALLRSRSWGASRALVQRVVETFGEPLDTGIPVLSRLAPRPEHVVEGGVSRLTALGVPRRRADAIVSVARALAQGTLRLEPGGDVTAAHRALLEVAGVGERLATTIVMHALHWPDAFPASDRLLLRAAGASSPGALRARAERWRPWRAYAALHLWLGGEEGRCTDITSISRGRTRSLSSRLSLLQ
jgi:AraC family transcriptional regulator of adaptative response / DNA-3-methyladenine glycosylase II